MNKIIPNHKWLTQKIIIGLVAVLLVSQLVLTNYLSTLGKELAVLSGQEEKLNAQNMSLQAVVGKKMSLERISQISNSLGLTHPKKIVFGISEQPVALRSGL